jgi:hypothetical protein
MICGQLCSQREEDDKFVTFRIEPNVRWTVKVSMGVVLLSGDAGRDPRQKGLVDIAFPLTAKLQPFPGPAALASVP